MLPPAPMPQVGVGILVIATPASDTLKTMEPQKCGGWAWFEWSDLLEPLFAPLVTLRSQGFVLENARPCG